MGGPEQLTLLSDDSTVQAGRVAATLSDARSILTPASGFMEEWDYTLNPYAGCGFGCNYCYAAFFARDPVLRDTWGEWVNVKQNATSLLRRFTRRKSLHGKSIYMSSVTDAYQPIERKLKLTRSILEELIPHQPRLAIQTRSPLVTRDVDLIRSFEIIQVNVTVTTDSEKVRRVFEPHCPTNTKRLATIETLTRSGVDTGVTLTPLLPVMDAQRFAADLAATGAQRFVVQPFHTGKGRFVRGTGAAATQLAESMEWNADRYQQVVDALRRALPNLVEGRDGFAPPK
ncbi:MAG: radical SAM protein [Acidimicrobiaceae bacterium]|nr:radical SAM protein [Acidimicrobiaceae bacterium]